MYRRAVPCVLLLLLLLAAACGAHSGGGHAPLAAAARCPAVDAAFNARVRSSLTRRRRHCAQ